MKRLTLLFTLLLTLCATAMAQYSFTIGERKNSFEEGDLVVIFSTCMVNGTSEYTAIYEHSGTTAGVQNVMPYASYVNNGSSVWVVDVLDGSTAEQPKLAFKPFGADTYWGIGGAMNNTEVGDNQTFTLVNYANRNVDTNIVGDKGEWCGNDVWGLDEEFNPIAPANITTEHKLFAVVAGNGKSLNTNGNQYQSGNAAAYPIAFYEAKMIDYSPEGIGEKGGDGRKVTSFKVGDKVYNLSASEQNQKYVDKSNVTFVVKAGDNIKAVMTSNASWMHSYVYIDEDKNGFSASIKEGSNYEPDGDLVSFSFFSTNGDEGWNSAGDYITGNNRSTLELPEFVAPETPGIYRLRTKYDWCSIDPAKSVGPDGNANGNLAIIDFTLKVVDAEYYNLLNELNENVENVELTTTAGEPGYIWTNAQSANEGPLSQLIDGIVGNSNNYFHTAYNGETNDPEHYFEIDLGEGNTIQNFYFDYTTRQNNQALDNIPNYCKILGSNNKVDYEEIKIINSGMPQNNNSYYKSAPIFAAKEYRYLRFVMKQNNNFFHLAEFDLYKYSYTDPYAIHLAEFGNELAELNIETVELETISEIVLNGNVITKLVEANNLFAESGYNTRNKIQLTVEEGEPGYIRTNAATTQEHNNQSATRGDLSNLIDGIVGEDINFFHTAYGGQSGTEEGYHFFEIDLGNGKGLKNFRFDYTTRKGAQTHFPKNIEVYGSNNGVMFAKIAEFSNLPASANTKVELGAVYAKEEYRYLRFKIRSSEVFFHMAEFNLYEIPLTAEYENKSVILGTIEPLLEQVDNLNSLSTEAKEEMLDEISFVMQLPANEYYSLVELVDEIKAKQYVSGSEFGTVTEASLNNLNSALQSAEPLAATFNSDADYAGELDKLIAAEAAIRLNGGNKYYRFKAYNNNDAYMVSMGAGTRMKVDVSPESGASIFYLDKNNQLLNYRTGTGINNTRETATFGGVTQTVSFNAVDGIENGFNILGSQQGNNGRYLYHHTVGNNETADVDRNSILAGDRTIWIVEEAEYLPVTVSAAGWSTFYTAAAVSVPENVNAYVIKGLKNADAAALTKVTTIPANTGVIVEANQGTYNFAIIDEEVAAIEDNLLRGTIAPTYITADAYILGIGDNGVGLYRPITDNYVQGTFLNSSHKAYFLASLVPNISQSNSFSLRFDDGITTAIENIDTENVKDVIYTIGGVRVDAITAPGLYIVNGKVVIVK